MSSVTSQVPHILDEVSSYYARKISEYGPIPQGVDWNGEESQHLRFQQLLRCVDASHLFSLNDLGCGYGALVDYLGQSGFDFTYYGYDVVAPMVTVAKQTHAENPRAAFSVGSVPTNPADYAVASGIFNVRQQRPDAEWLNFILETIGTLNSSSIRGFSFNCLTSYSDANKKRGYLYYADPCFLFDHCIRRFGRNVSLLHDYDLYEFTIIVRKNP
jgi:SAM-dependent methyltransferase